MVQGSLSIEERFEQYVWPEPNSGCYLWSGGVNDTGYGLFTIGSRRNRSVKKVLAHRLAWEISRGPIPPGICVLHKCDTPCCVNPDHLFLGTRAENSFDMSRKERGVKSASGMPYGVARCGRKFQAQIWIAGRSTYLGLFSTIEEASLVAMAERRRRDGLPGVRSDRV